MLLYPAQLKHLWFQQKQVEANSDCVLNIGKYGDFTLYPVWAISNKWQ